MEDSGNNIKTSNAGWSFGGDVPSVFDAHVRQSVPLYAEGQDLLVKYSDFFVAPRSVVYDLGCSVGTLSAMLADRHKEKDAKIFGIDVERGMIDQAVKENSRNNLEYLLDSAVEIELTPCAFVSSYYTLQFIPPSVRQAVVDKIYQALEWGGGFIIFEKVRASDARFQDYATQLYNEFKIQNGYSPGNIISKSKSLKRVLEPFSTDGNIEMFKRAGFKDIMTIQKYVNFEGFLAIK